MNATKPRVVKDFEKLDQAVQQKVKLTFPYGFTEDLTHYHDKEGNRVSALPFETDDRYYLIRMTVSQAMKIVEDDDDYQDGELKEEIKSDYAEKFADEEMDEVEDEDKDPYADKDEDRDEDDEDEDI